MPVDHELINALHVDALRHSDLVPEHDPHVIFQTSTLDALLDGAYDGDVTFAELREHGDFGLGTFDACDGEMIALEGRFYQAKADGTIEAVVDTQCSPFAAVTFFDPDESVEFERDLSQPELLGLLDERIATKADCYALRIDGRFDFVQARSVAKQSKPYKPLTEVVEAQTLFEFRDVEGTMVGFRFPNYAQGLGVAGYHLHFLTADRLRGGHVLDFRIARASVEIDHSSNLHLELPIGVDLAARDTSDAKREEIRKIEG